MLQESHGKKGLKNSGLILCDLDLDEIVPPIILGDYEITPYRNGGLNQPGFDGDICVAQSNFREDVWVFRSWR